MGPSEVWRIAGVLAVLSAAGIALSGCSAETRADPRPTTATQTLPPILGQAWWRTDLPVDGSLESLGATASGDVTVVRDGIASLRITITGYSLTGSADPDPDLRVQLASGDVTERSHATVYLPSGDPVEVGTIDGAPGTVVIEFENPQVLPLEIHSLVIVDFTTDTRLAAAELVPSG